MLSPSEIDNYSRKPVVSFKQAHGFLSRLRELHEDTQDNTFFHDLTNSEKDFTWKGWVCQRPDVKEIVGEGIYCFACVWLPSKDTNSN